MASPNNALKVLELCRVSPPSSVPLSLPLTFFDVLWLKFHPVERLFFYSLPHSDPSFFFHSVIPQLKSSLSLTLHHFLPLAGNIIWPGDLEKPIIQYTPGDGVSLVIAESDADFNYLSDNAPRAAIDSRPLVPQLDTSDSFASVMSLQVTLFGNKGFCIGISTHHAVLDGKSSTLFMKAWTYLCQNREKESLSLLPELKPFLDRNVIKDPNGLAVLYLDIWTAGGFVADARSDSNHTKDQSLKILHDKWDQNLDNSVRATFELSIADLEKIKKRVLSIWDEVDTEELVSPKLSTFVLTCAYVLVCIVKAFERAEGQEKKVAFGFPMDCRSWLQPPIPVNYLGNCVFSSKGVFSRRPGEFTKEDGLVKAAKKICGLIKTLENGGVLDEAESLFSNWRSLASEHPIISIGVAGSPRFGVYESDFGWGRPVKVEIASVDRNPTIALAEGKEGGVEVGLVLKKHVMDLFAASFHAGLELHRSLL